MEEGGATPVLAAKAFMAACMLCCGVIPKAPNCDKEFKALSEGLFLSRSLPEDEEEAECGDINGLLPDKLGCMPPSEALLALTLVEALPLDMMPPPMPMPWPCSEEEEDEPPPPPDFLEEEPPPEPEPEEAAAATACMASSSLCKVTGS